MVNDSHSLIARFETTLRKWIPCWAEAQFGQFSGGESHRRIILRRPHDRVRVATASAEITFKRSVLSHE